MLDSLVGSGFAFGRLKSTGKNLLVLVPEIRAVQNMATYLKLTELFDLVLSKP